MFKNFDFGWFLTTPGMLTCLGCLLIIISIIIFISSLRSNKKTNAGDINTNTQGLNVNPSDMESIVSANMNQVNAVSVDGMAQPANINGQVAVSPVEMPTVTVTPEVKPVEVASINTPVAATSTTVAPQVTPVEVKPVSIAPESATVAQTSIIAPEVKPVEATPISIAPEITPASQTPINIMPEAKPVEINPINITTEVSKTPEINATPAVQTEVPHTSTSNQSGFAGINIQPNIQPIPPVNNNIESNPVNLPYGGVSPTVTSLEGQSPENKVIYGGANPLAGTGVFSTVQPTQELKKSEDIESL